MKNRFAQIFDEKIMPKQLAKFSGGGKLYALTELRVIRYSQEPNFTDTGTMITGVRKMSEIQESVIKIIAEQLCKEANEIKLEDNLHEDLGADSLDIIELSMTIRDKFGLKVEFKNNIPVFHTVGDVANFIEKKVAETAN